MRSFRTEGRKEPKCPTHRASAPRNSISPKTTRGLEELRAGEDKKKEKGLGPVDCVISFPISSPDTLKQQNVARKEKSIRAENVPSG